LRRHVFSGCSPCIASGTTARTPQSRVGSIGLRLGRVATLAPRTSSASLWVGGRAPLAGLAASATGVSSRGRGLAALAASATGVSSRGCGLAALAAGAAGDSARSRSLAAGAARVSSRSRVLPAFAASPSLSLAAGAAGRCGAIVGVARTQQDNHCGGKTTCPTEHSRIHCRPFAWGKPSVARAGPYGFLYDRAPFEFRKPSGATDRRLRFVRRHAWDFSADQPTFLFQHHGSCMRKCAILENTGSALLTRWQEE